MSSMPNEAQVIDTTSTLEKTEMSDGLRFARYRMLDELPGLVFGALALVYIVQSLSTLIP